MLVPEGFCLDLKNEILFRPRRLLPNRHGNEKGSIDRTDSTPPAFDCPEHLAPSFLEDAQIGVETRGYDSQSQMIVPSLLSDPPRASIILTSEQPSRPGEDIADLHASPLSSASKIGSTDWSKHNSRLHSLGAMGGADTLGNPLARSFPSRPLDDLVTQSPVIMPIPYETSSGSLIEPRRTGVTIALLSQKAEPAADDIIIQCNDIPTSSSTASSNLNTDTSTSSPPFIQAAPSTKETTYPSVKSRLTTPVTAGVAARTNPTDLVDESPLIPPFMPMAIVPNLPRSFNVKRKPPLPQSNLAKSSPMSIIAGQTSSGACGGSSSPQGIASSSLMSKAVSKPSLPISSMDRKVELFSGEESYPFSSASKPRSVASTSSGSSYLTTVGPNPQSLRAEPSPPSRRTFRLSMKRLLPKPASSSPPKGQKLVKCSSRVPEGSSVVPSNRSVDTGMSGRTLGDHTHSSSSPGSKFDSGGPVYPQHSSSSILSVINKVLRSDDVVLSEEHQSSILIGDVQSPNAQPDVQAFTNSRDRNGVCQIGGADKGPPFARNRKDSKIGKINGGEMDNKPARRQRNVLRKRSHPRMIGLSRSTSTLGSSRSPSDHDGCTFAAIHTEEQERFVHGNRRLHDIDRISINQPQSVAVPDRPDLETLHSSTGLFNGGPRPPRREGVGDIERFTPAALIAMECKANMLDGSRNPDEGYVAPRDGKPEEPTHNAMSIDRSLLRSASMSEILFLNPSQAQTMETTCYEREKRARQSLNLSIVMHRKDLDEEKPRKSADVVSNKASGGRLRKLMKKFSLSRSGGKPGEQTPMAFPSRTELGDDQGPSCFKPETRSRTSVGPSRHSISSPEISSVRQAAPKSSRAYDVPPLPKHLISVPLDLHIVNPRVLDQTYHEEEDRSQPDVVQNLSALPASESSRVPPEGEWIRSNSPDLELAALPLPPRRASKVSTGPPSQSGIEADDTHSRSTFVPVVGNTIDTFPQPMLATFPPRPDSLNLQSRHGTSPTKNSADLLRDVPNLSSVIPSISVSPPPHRPSTNTQRPNLRRLFIGDTHPRRDPLLRVNANNTPPLQGYSSEARHTPYSHTTIAQPMPLRRSTVQDPPLQAEETDSYLTFTRSSLSATPSVVFRPGTANTFGGSETLGSINTPGTSDSIQSAISTSLERIKSYSPLAGSSLRLTASPTSFASTETPD